MKMINSTHLGKDGASLVASTQAKKKKRMRRLTDEEKQGSKNNYNLSVMKGQGDN